MTERVLSVPPALFLSGLALSVTFGDTSFPSLSPAVTFLPGAGRICPGAGEVCQRERPWQRDEVCVDCQRLSLWESCQGRSALTERAQDICLREPSQSRLTPCQLPRKGSFSRSGGKQSKTSPFRGRWHRAAMTERVQPAENQQHFSAAPRFRRKRRCNCRFPPRPHP